MPVYRKPTGGSIIEAIAEDVAWITSLGNDGTAELGNPLKPYATIQAGYDAGASIFDGTNVNAGPLEINGDAAGTIYLRGSDFTISGITTEGNGVAVIGRGRHTIISGDIESGIVGGSAGNVLLFDCYVTGAINASGSTLAEVGASSGNGGNVTLNNSTVGGNINASGSVIDIDGGLLGANGACGNVTLSRNSVCSGTISTVGSPDGDSPATGGSVSLEDSVAGDIYTTGGAGGQVTIIRAASGNIYTTALTTGGAVTLTQSQAGNIDTAGGTTSGAVNMQHSTAGVINAISGSGALGDGLVSLTLSEAEEVQTMNFVYKYAVVAGIPL